MARKQDIDIPSDWGLPPPEAIEVFSAPEKWREFERLRDSAPRGRRARTYSTYIATGTVVEPGSYGPRIKQPVRPHKVLERELEREFHERLLEGDLVATAYEWPMSPNSKRILIPCELWEYLRLRYEAIAVGSGMKLVHVRIGRPEDAPFRVRLKTGAVAPGTPGRRTLIPRAYTEMERRAKERDLAPSLMDEAAYLERFLADWVQAEIKQGRSPPNSPKEKSIANALRLDYWRLRREWMP